MTINSKLPALSEEDLQLLSDALITEQGRVARAEGPASPKLERIHRLHLLICERLVACDQVAQLVD